ncbi:MAG: glycosyltransferase family 2 protein [Marivita sp.]|uniref:glycosyltransferase family 2 protein n=1 Tax=Marivita sp. TaxID=2003365 RepID=UPI003EF967CF
MQIVGVSVVKNEDDVIEAMVRHNLQVLDHLHVVDNGSTDRTQAILSALADEGLAVTHEVNDALQHIQAGILTDLVNGAYVGDHVVLLDSDEFLICTADALRDLFATAKGPVTIPWVTYVPRPTDRQDDLNPLTRITHHRRREKPQYFKVLIPASVPRPVEVMAGSHGLKKMKAEPHEAVKLAHFPVRSPMQIAGKVLIGSWNMSLRDKSRKEGYQWHALAEQIKADGLPDLEMLEEIGNSYAAKGAVRLVDDPIQTQITRLRYTKPAGDQFIMNVAGFVDRVIFERD